MFFYHSRSDAVMALYHLFRKGLFGLLKMVVFTFFAL